MIVLITLFFTILSPIHLISGREQQKIINNLKNLFENTYLFNGCVFGLFDTESPDHKEYYEVLKSKQVIMEPLWNKLHYELVPTKLRFFHQFKERIDVTRKYGSHKKNEADYCLLYLKQYHAKTKPDNKNYQRYYDEDLIKCNNKYDIFCSRINNLESYTNEAFLRYYSLGHFSSKCVYDHSLVQLANGDVEKAVDLIDDFLEQVNKENNDLKAEQLLNIGVTFIEAMEYAKAIYFLNKSIEKDPLNKEAYFQRAIANLETGIFHDAISDFLVSEKGKDLTQLGSIVSNDFRDAFLNGLLDGSTEALTNFFPSLYSFAYANTFHPIDSLTNYVNSCYSLMCLTADYLKEIDWSSRREGLLNQELSIILLEPGLKRLYERMDGLTPAEQGHLLWHAIGSYGTDFIAGVGIIKSLSNCAKLANACKTAREAGRIYELEILAQPMNYGGKIPLDSLTTCSR